MCSTIVLNMETLCFCAGNTMFPCRKHAVSLLMTMLNPHISQVMCHIIRAADSPVYVCSMYVLCMFFGKHTFSNLL